MEPGSETFLPAKYTLRICDTNDRKGHILYYQAATPFPNMSVGDILKTISWPLSYEGRLCVIEEIHHSVWSLGDEAYCETYVYCRFPDSTQP